MTGWGGGGWCWLRGCWPGWHCRLWACLPCFGWPWCPCGPWLAQPQHQRIAGPFRDVAPDLRRLPAVHHEDVEQAVEVEVGKGTAARNPGAGDARLVRHLHECAVRPLDEEVVGILERAGAGRAARTLERQ